MAANPPKSTETEQVQAYLQQLEHPLKPAIVQVRELVLAAHPDLTEHIKWNAPSFCFRGEDRLTFQLRGTASFRLIFHCGAKARPAPANGRLITDHHQLLEWAADDRAVATFTCVADVQAKAAALTDVVQQWLAASC